jgi:hypothetical protein
LPEGGKVELLDGRVVNAVSWAWLDELLDRFDVLDPFGDGGKFWDDRERGTEDRPLHIVSLGSKRYVLAQPNADGSFEVVGGTEHSLGGEVVDPPRMRGRNG